MSSSSFWNVINIYSFEALFFFLCLVGVIIGLFVTWNQSKHGSNGVPEQGTTADTLSGVAIILGLSFLVPLSLLLQQRRASGAYKKLLARSKLSGINTQKPKQLKKSKVVQNPLKLNKNINGKIRGGHELPPQTDVYI